MTRKSRTYTVVERIPAREVRTTFKVRADGTLEEPRCPGCDMLVNRPKCAFELGGDCPRHPLAEAYRQALRERAEKR